MKFDERCQGLLRKLVIANVMADIDVEVLNAGNKRFTEVEKWHAERVAVRVARRENCDGPFS